MNKSLTKLTQVLTFKRLYFAASVILMFNAFLVWDKAIEYTALSMILAYMSRKEEN